MRHSTSMSYLTQLILLSVCGFIQYIITPVISITEVNQNSSFTNNWWSKHLQLICRFIVVSPRHIKKYLLYFCSIVVVGYSPSTPTIILLKHVEFGTNAPTLNPGYAPTCEWNVHRSSVRNWHAARACRLFQWHAVWKSLRNWALRWPGETKSGKDWCLFPLFAKYGLRLFHFLTVVHNSLWELHVCWFSARCLL